MNPSKRTLMALLIVISMLLSGCTAENEEEESEENIDDNMPLENCELNNSCFEPNEEIITIPHSDGCDNINPIHCMLPFPSSAFLVDDSSTVSGKRIDYSPTTLPGSGSKSVIEIPLINQMDGFSTSTQIMTSFSTIPNLDSVASQNDIALSMDLGHATMLVNMNTGELVEHWVEVDARAEENEESIVHIRTTKHLEFSTEYGVVIHGLTDESGQTMELPQALSAVINGDITSSPDIENRRNDMSNLIDYFTEEKEVDKSKIQAVWSFTTNSAESALGPIIHMRDDALERIGGVLVVQ